MTAVSLNSTGQVFPVSPLVLLRPGDAGGIFITEEALVKCLNLLADAINVQHDQQTQFEASATNRLDALKTRMAALEDEFVRVDETTARQAEVVKTQAADVQLMKKRIEEQILVIAAKAAEMTEVDRRMKLMERVVAGSKTEVAQLKTSAQQQLTALTSSVNKAEEQIISQTSAFEKLDADVSDRITTTLRSVTAGMNELVASHDQRIQDLQQLRPQLQELYAQVQRELPTFAKNAELAGMQHSMAETKETLDEVNKRLAVMTRMFSPEELNSLREFVNKKCAAMDVVAGDVQARLAEAGLETAKLQLRMIQRLQAKVKDISDSIRETPGGLAGIERKIELLSNQIGSLVGQSELREIKNRLETKTEDINQSVVGSFEASESIRREVSGQHVRVLRFLEQFLHAACRGAEEEHGQDVSPVLAVFASQLQGLISSATVDSVSDPIAIFHGSRRTASPGSDAGSRTRRPDSAPRRLIRTGERPASAVQRAERRSRDSGMASNASLPSLHQ
mmetsp:Transcript_58534/g.128346  ORF Transcript_58534/g.128346 Transcript_58534/m.128346 type:complete len:508 (-) Transcript_58534:53-1576(-)|eukprot:CAMPEP_0204367278 /NCGR_PEP_ID=MMETSP0469-20131031/43284_1 /ASSEMBLY_ACC=CAM_ASM_000384 /TAXON_ID=2969 /ORGANISM="Oxyrrhis marina" /LENGTH=507 /DNA_ID=CAMNT_0051356631 /DNA_START=34 /DNA_END=1557 /DNA_ORIENTATION=+